jgi:hypothetical protein
MSNLQKQQSFLSKIKNRIKKPAEPYLLIGGLVTLLIIGYILYIEGFKVMPF